MKYWWFEFWYNLFGPITLALQVWFTFYAILALFLPRPLVVFLALPFITVDVLYNWVVGSILFFELPREFMLTTRLKRLDKQGRWGVERFKRVLNYLDEGHI